jgi:hypothetical protein
VETRWYEVHTLPRCSVAGDANRFGSLGQLPSFPLPVLSRRLRVNILIDFAAW